MVEFDHFRASAGKNSFVLPPQQWIEATHAIGMVSKSGRYGGTYAHSDIAFKFAAWLSPAFELYIIKDYQRLKQVESDHLSLDWSARREIAKTNYKIHTDAIKEHLIRSDLPARYVNLTYANEADVINVALFGMTAKEWRDRTLMLTLLLVQPPSNAIFDEEKYPICDLHHLPLIIAAKKKIIICLNDECPLSRIPIMPVYFSFQNFIPEHIQ